MPESVSGELREVGIEFETASGAEYEYLYKKRALGRELYKLVENLPGEKKRKRKGEDAKAEIDSLIAQLRLHPEMSHDELLLNVTDALKLERDRLKELEIDVEFKDGREIEIKRK